MSEGVIGSLLGLDGADLHRQAIGKLDELANSPRPAALFLQMGGPVYGPLVAGLGESRAACGEAFGGHPDCVGNRPPVRHNV